MKLIYMNKMPEIERENLNIMEVPGEDSKKELISRGRGAPFFSQSLRSREKWAGFTLVELMISVTLAALLAVIGFTTVVSLKQRQEMDFTTQEIVITLRNAQDRSISQENSITWGVHFENSTSSDFFDLFKGTSYSAGTVVLRKNLISGIEFTEPAGGSSSTIIFASVTGLPNASTTVKISLINKPAVSSTISVNSSGKINY
jgi:prepilin-type N-terminal cleavage/methylation domain-containing protein